MQELMKYERWTGEGVSRVTHKTYSTPSHISSYLREAPGANLCAKFKINKKLSMKGISNKN